MLEDLWGDGSEGQGAERLLGEGIGGSVRLGRLVIGMISKSATKNGTLIVHQVWEMSLNITKGKGGPKVKSIIWMAYNLLYKPSNPKKFPLFQKVQFFPFQSIW